MAVRKIQRSPSLGRNYYLVDANFLANRHIPMKFAPEGHERERIRSCQEWWREIEAQLAVGLGRVYVPDICIAEAFKVLAKKYYQDKWFPNRRAFSQAKEGLSDDIRIPSHVLKAATRKVAFHDISTNRDIIIAVDRFFELLLKHKKRVQIADLILLATAKYLFEFFDLPRHLLHIVTLDSPLREGISRIPELPNAYDPTKAFHRASCVFTSNRS
ncbi:MAG: hypothetical protein ACE145_21995 [Terriglobia bacterium]